MFHFTFHPWYQHILGLFGVLPRTLRRRRSAAMTFALAVLLLPAALSPTHPVAVYGYVAATYLPAMSPVYADAGGGLPAFLISSGQVQRYRRELLADMADTASGKLFAVTRGTDGLLRHAPIRTWNSFLPAGMPQALRGWLDRKEFPFLADEVELWQQGQSIVAMGHYHVFGGGPSAGDRLAQRISEVPEVVVSNGIVPLVYLRGAIVPYGEDVAVAPQLHRALRAMERGLTMGVGEATPLASEPSLALVAFLGFLREHEKVDITNQAAVARAISELCTSFRADYQPFFEEGFAMDRYSHHPDKANVVRNLTVLRGWGSVYQNAPT